MWWKPWTARDSCCSSPSRCAGGRTFIDAKRACDAGEIGELFMAESHYVHDLRPVYKRTPWRITMPQDLILGGACHPIDLLRWFMGDIDEVHCVGLRSGDRAGVSTGGLLLHQR